MKKNFDNIIKLVTIFTFLLLTSCEFVKKAWLDPVNMRLVAAERYSSVFTSKDNKNKILSQVLSSFRSQKKYDLLEKELLKHYKDKNQSFYKQLFITIDLADFYTYGFINFRKALEFYNEAMEYNRQIYKNNSVESEDNKNFICEETNYFITNGNSTIPRVYSYKETLEHINKNIFRINRILGNKTLITANDNKFSNIVYINTNNYSEAMKVKDIFPSSLFEEVEQNIIEKTNNYFEQRLKLSENEKKYYSDLNIAKGLIRSFDINSISQSQCEKILNRIEIALSYNEQYKTNFFSIINLHFGKILCLNKKKQYIKVISNFKIIEKFLEQMEKNKEDLLNHLKESKNKAQKKLILGIGTTAILAAITKDINLMNLSVQELSIVCDFYDYHSDILIHGDSNYTKKLSIAFNTDEQLQLFKALGESYSNIKGMTNESIKYNKHAITIINNLRSTITSEKNRISFAKYKDSIYNKIIDKLIIINNYEDALLYSEKSRSRALVDLLGSRNNIDFGSENLTNFVIQQKDAQISKDYIQKNKGITLKQVSYVNSLLKPQEDLLKKDYISQLKDEAIEDKKELISLITVKERSKSELQHMLPKESAILEYYISDTSVHVWLIDKTKIFYSKSKININQLKKKVVLFDKALLKPNFRKSMLVIKKIGLSLYQNLIKTIENKITYKQLYIVPHRFLHMLPFEALYNGKGFLVQQFNISYLPSISLLEFLSPTNKKLNSIIALGNPLNTKLKGLDFLKGAEDEVIKISDLFSIKKIYTGLHASETNLRYEAMNYDIMHIACHGIFDNKIPMNSRLILSSDKKNDGIISSTDLYGIKIKSNLVVLSACETAKTFINNGDELIGLIRGFFFAGASSLVASLWKVNDKATYQLMSNFYSCLINSDMKISQALQQSKINMLSHKFYQHPFYWAAFNIYGLGL